MRPYRRRGSSSSSPREKKIAAKIDVAGRFQALSGRMAYMMNALFFELLYLRLACIAVGWLSSDSSFDGLETCDAL